MQKRHLNVSKNWNKNLDVDNVRINRPVKFQFKICCILGLRKKTNMTKNSSFENMYRSYNLDLQIWLFCYAPKYKEFGPTILHTSTSDYKFHLEFLFQFFWNFWIPFFEKFEKQAQWSSGAICPFSSLILLLTYTVKDVYMHAG
jgi:hypothetical protein